MADLWRVTGSRELNVGGERDVARAWVVSVKSLGSGDAKETVTVYLAAGRRLRPVSQDCKGAVRTHGISALKPYLGKTPLPKTLTIGKGKIYPDYA